MRWNASARLALVVVTLAGSPALAQDTTPPTAFDLMFPENSDWARATPSFWWSSSSDTGGIARYDLYVDGAIRHGGIATSPYVLAESEALTEGFHTWFVRAYDTAGNMRQSTSTWTVRVDATPPTSFSLIEPADNAWQGAWTPFSWSSSADSGVGLAGYRLYLGGSDCGEFPSTATSGGFAEFTGICRWQFDGTYDWYVVAIDRVGNFTPTETRTVLLDRTDPVPSTLLEPAADACTADQMPTFSWTAATDTGSGVTGYDMCIDAAPINANADFRSGVVGWAQTVCASCCSRSWSSGLASVHPVSRSTPGLLQQTITIPHCALLEVSIGILAFSSSCEWDAYADIDVVDADGVRTGLWGALLAACNPWQHLVLDLTPWSGTTVTLEILGTAGGVQGWSNECVYVDYARVWGGTHTYAVDATDTDLAIPDSVILGDGPWYWHVFAHDAVENRAASEQRRFTVDTTPPGNFDLSAPMDESCAGFPTPSLCWSSATDATCGVTSYELWLNGARATDDIPSSSRCATSSVPLAEGAYTWEVVAEDGVGNRRISSSARTVYADWNPPAPFTLIDPPSGATVSTLSPTFTWTASADASGLDRYDLYVDGSPVAAAIEPHAASPPLMAGIHQWHVVATDRCGATTASETLTFTARECAPGATERCVGEDRGECDPGERSCGPDERWRACTGVVLPADEVIDRLDNDCDGETDEGFGLGVSCTAGIGACERHGTNIYSEDGTNVVCDAVPGEPTEETCDGADNDCDGSTDIGTPGHGDRCDNGQSGGCRREGMMRCPDEGSALVCDAADGSASAGAEVCDGLDNDCDSETDEDFALGEPCGVGFCSGGEVACAADGGTRCTSEFWGEPEMCDGADNDCNGIADVDTVGYGTACDNGQHGVCARGGTMHCPEDGGPIACDAPDGSASSGTEFCDGLDNDCDGETDEEGCTAGDDDAADDDAAGDDDMVGDDDTAGDDDLADDDVVAGDDDVEGGADDDLAGNDDDRASDDDGNGAGTVSGDDTPPVRERTGCGCGASGGASALGPFLFALIGLRRPRRR